MSIGADAAAVSAGSKRRGRSLFWVIAGAFLSMALIGTLVQAFLALAVLRPLEARETRSRAELFDIVKDPNEKSNVAAEHPDVTKRLSEEVIAWDKSIESSAPPAPTSRGKQ